MRAYSWKDVPVIYGVGTNASQPFAEDEKNYKKDAMCWSRYPIYELNISINPLSIPKTHPSR